jgi:hypothetical protein
MVYKDSYLAFTYPILKRHTMEQLLCHLIGDYCLQSDYMATEKVKRSVAAVYHCLLYTFCFTFLTYKVNALCFIFATHFLIDRFRLAKYVCYAKNFMSPRTYWYEWVDCNATGYHTDRSMYLSVWLLIITDNTMHLLCNYIALRYF